MKKKALKIDESVRLTRQEESELRHLRILDAARDCFCELGYQKTTINKIAQKAGVSNGLMYSFYSGKAALFDAVVRRVVEKWQRFSADRLHGHQKEPKEKLKIMCRCIFDFALHHPLLMALPRHDYEYLLPGGSKALKKANAAWQQLMAETIRAGVASGEFRNDLDIRNTVDVINALQQAHIARMFRRNRTIAPLAPELIDAMISLIINGLAKNKVSSQ